MKRAILVFFENIEKLMKFYESDELSFMVGDIKILTEESSIKEKENIVVNCSTSGSCTLLTRCFGRGTDF